MAERFPPVPPPPAAKAVKIVRMHHPERDNKEADVHPAEVDSWKVTGWREGEAPNE